VAERPSGLLPNRLANDVAPIAGKEVGGPVPGTEAHAGTMIDSDN
jgi:hypothetical protein